MLKEQAEAGIPGDSIMSKTAKAIATSPILWGGAMTFGFYRLLPHLPMYRDMATRYFCSHPLEYVTATLFFVGMAILIRKGFSLGSEKAAFRQGFFENGIHQESDLDQILAETDSKLNQLPKKLQQTLLAQRISDICSYLKGRKGTVGLEEHLKYVSELAAEKLYESFALVRTITWAVPILGFLGTVIGITLAIANVTPDQLDSSLSEVTGGLAVAFDTTALALGLSLVLVFCSFMIEQFEQRILSQVEQFGIKRLVNLLPAGNPESDGPLAEAERQAAENLLAQTEQLVHRQTDLWQESLESLRERWTDTLEHQQQLFEANLKQGMESSLTDHAVGLQSVRNEFLQAFQLVSEKLDKNMQAWTDFQQSEREQFHEQTERIIQKLDAVQVQQSDTLGEVTQQVSSHVVELREKLDGQGVLALKQMQELKRQGDILLKVVESEQDLSRLQTQLNQNLDSLRTAETFEQTLHSLSAAVHLLTARAGSKAA